jgi:hypothetical protein
MKKFGLSIALLVITSLILSACAGALAPSGPNCSQGVCVKVRVIEPVHFDEPVTVIITVTTREDIPRLGVSLYFSDLDIVVEGPQGWERGGVDWIVDVKANRPIHFTRKIRFPPREGYFDVIASANTPSLRAVDSVVLHITHAGGRVYPSGTKIPITPGPLPTIIPVATPTRRPTITPPSPPTPTYMSPMPTPTRPSHP